MYLRVLLDRSFLKYNHNFFNYRKVTFFLKIAAAVLSKKMRMKHLLFM